MKRLYRLRRNENFQKVISKHHILKSDEYIIYFNKNDLEFTRIGISVSKKIGDAVIRNKIKRQIKAMLNDLMKLDRNIDIVIIVRNEYLGKTFKDNKVALKKIIDKIQ